MFSESINAEDLDKLRIKKQTNKVKYPPPNKKQPMAMSFGPKKTSNKVSFTNEKNLHS
jgi:hypothetical protein